MPCRDGWIASLAVRWGAQCLQAVWTARVRLPDKERAQLLWVAHMNGLKAQVEEAVVREVVYAE